MNAFGFIFAAVAAVLFLALPRRWALLPLLLAACFITLQQQMEVGPCHFSVVRLLIAVGSLRVLFKGERVAGALNSIDRLMFAWAAWAVCSLVFHKSSAVVFRLGITYDILGAYLLYRVFIRGVDDVIFAFKMVCVLLVPVALMMLVERTTGRNPLGLIGFAPATSELRNGYFRAQGAFGHSILGGNAGAICIPMALYLWRRERKFALAGLAATLAMVYASGSSGPILTTMSVFGAMALWRYRTRLGAIRWLVVLLIVALDLVMNDPVYFLMARIDITGGSTGYFRAQLIKSAIDHLDEWWLAGTDYTRHWMATGIAVDPNNTDMTNYYLQMGVWGGLPLMLLFMGVLAAAFAAVGRLLRISQEEPDHGFLAWTLGAILFGHATSFFSISYFDQTVVFLFLVIAAIATLASVQRVAVPASQPEAPWAAPQDEPDLYRHC